MILLERGTAFEFKTYSLIQSYQVCCGRGVSVFPEASRLGSGFKSNVCTIVKQQITEDQNYFL